jgi:hypothetical protein
MNSNISKCVFALLMLLLFVGINSVQAVNLVQSPINSFTPPENIDEMGNFQLGMDTHQQIGPRRDDPTVEGRFLLVHGVNATRDYWWGDIEGIFISNDLDYDRITDPADLANIDLSQYDVIWVGDWQTDEWNRVYNNYRGYIDDWVYSCGVLYHCSGSNYNPTKPIHPGGLIYTGDDQYYVSDAYTAVSQAECLFFDLLDWDLNTHLTGTLFSHTHYDEGEIADVAEGGDYQVLVTDQQDGEGAVLVARYGYGFGQVVVTGTVDAFAVKYGQSWSAIDPDMFRYLMSLTGPTDAEEMIQFMIDMIWGWVRDGKLNQNHARFLTYDLDRALRSVQNEQTRYAIAYMNDFLRRVGCLTWWGILCRDQAALLVDLTNHVLYELGAIGDASLEGLIASVESELPDIFCLNAAYPNPFNSTTTISFTLPFEMQTSLTVYDVTGRQVATLVDGIQQMGIHSAAFNADRLTTGMYFVVLNAGGKVLTQKVMLVR